MLYSNKAAVAVISILFVVVLFLLATYINSSLDAPQYFDGYILDSDGNLESKPILNPKYLSGLQRSLYEFLYDFLPTGQSVQYMTFVEDAIIFLDYYNSDNSCRYNDI